MILIDRVNKEHKINTALIKDVIDLHPDICKAFKVLMLDKTHFNYREPDSSIEENIKAINTLLSYVSNDKANFDLVMMKQALIWFIGQDIRYDRGTFEEQMLLKILLNGDDNMVDKLEVGTTIIDRNGKEFKAYSSLITEYKESLELLAKVDIVDISQNIDDTEAQEALLEIIYRALNKAVTKKKILKSLDAEFARKCIRVYYDLPIGA